MIKTQILPAVSLTLVFALFTGIAFPAMIWLCGQLLFPYQANGSIVEHGGKGIGSEIIGQLFSSPKYFHPRPSAAGSGYDPLSSSGTNLGPTSKKLIAGLPDDPTTPNTDESFTGVEGLAKAFREENGLGDKELLPADAVTRSGSGLDPHISPKNAQLQAARVARERKLTVQEMNALIEKMTEKRLLGIFGEPRVNVLQINLALDDIEGQLSK